jgi:DNA mismatch repair protein MutS
MVQSNDFYNLYQATYKKYTELYGKQVCVFLKKGSFYEFYGQQDPKTEEYLNNVKQVVDFFEIALHVQEGPNGNIGLFGGVPEYTLDKWAGKLTRTGWTVVVMDEIKDGSGKILRREVTRVLSPGTHIESADCAEGDVFTLCAVWMEQNVESPPKFGVVSVDLTTGALTMYEGQATGTKNTWHTDDLRHFFQVSQPREVLFGWRAPPFLKPSTEELRRILYVPSAVIQDVDISKEKQGTLETSCIREDYMRTMFQPRTALPLRTWLHLPSDITLTERALCLLLRYVEDHVPKLASCLHAPRVWHPEQNLQIINNALTQLNLIGQQYVVKDLFSKPQTAMGRRELGARLCMPLTQSSEIVRRHEEIDWFLQRKQLLKTVDTSLLLVYDLSRLHRTIVRATTKAADIDQLHQSYTTLQFLSNQLKGPPFENKDIPIFLHKCLKEFQTVFDIEKAKKALKEEKEDEIGFLQSSVAPKTHECEKAIEDIYKTAKDWLSSFIELCNLEPSSIYYKPTEKNMFSIHCTKAALKLIEMALKKPATHSLYKKITVKTLSSGGRCEHPDVDMFQTRLDAAKASLQRALNKEVPQACIEYLKTRDNWDLLESWTTNIDLAICMAKTAEANGFCRPLIQDGGDGPSGVWVENLRHPLIEIQKTKSQYVTHTVDIGYNKQPSWLLYGMNASGKSSLMKAIGLSVLLAQVGSFVPATAMKLRPFKKLATRILNQDNLWAGLSSFAVEMSELREIFQVADHQTLVLGDELCAGTESVSATAIVAAGISWLQKCGSRFVFATHLHDLMKFPEITESTTLSVWHLHVEYDIVKDILIYHRQLRQGSGSTLYGLEVAKALHLPPDLLSAALKFRQKLLSETPIEELQKSQWNASVIRRACEVCNNPVESDLEVHHVLPRENAINKRNQDGTALHGVKNLAVLCEECHDKHHSGSLSVGPVEDTSEGPRRRLEQYRYNPSSASTDSQSTKELNRNKKKSPFTEEQYIVIKETIRKNKELYHYPRLMAIQIRNEHEIEITEAQLKVILKTLD